MWVELGGNFGASDLKLFLLFLSLFLLLSTLSNRAIEDRTSNKYAAQSTRNRYDRRHPSRQELDCIWSCILYKRLCTSTQFLD